MPKHLLTLTHVMSALLFVGFAGAATSATAQSGSRSQSRRGVLYRPGIHATRSTSGSNGETLVIPPNMVYNGGPVLPDTTVYAIWWGKPSDFPADAQEGLDTFLSGLDGSDFLHIADQYMLGAKAHTHFGGNLYDFSEPISVPVDPNFASNNIDFLYPEVLAVLAKNGMKPDPTAIYALFTSNYPTEGFDIGFCAFHTFDTSPDGTLFHLAYLPNLGLSLAGCGSNFDPLFDPNHYSESTRAIVSVTAHEFMETITDPNLNAWIAPNGSEVGDPCIYMYQLPVPIDDEKWKIQTIWSNESSGCVQGAGPGDRVIGASGNPARLVTYDSPASIYGAFSQSLNASGTSIGNYTDANDAYHAFVWDFMNGFSNIDPSGTTDELLTGGGEAAGINNEGSVVGTYFDANFVGHGFVRDSRGNYAIFDSPSASGITEGHVINDRGDAAGDYIDANYTRHGYFRDTGGSIAEFDPPGIGQGEFNGTFVLAINRAGSVAGQFSDVNSVWHGFIRGAHGTITVFDAPGAGSLVGTGTFAPAMNDTGEIAGYYTGDDFNSHGFIRDARGRFATFDAPGAVFGTFAYGINSNGSVTGYFSDASGVSHGFIRDPGGKFTTVNAPGAKFGTVLRSINDAGNVAGYATVPVP